jgi:hypothetical protein
MFAHVRPFSGDFSRADEMEIVVGVHTPKFSSAVSQTWLSGGQDAQVDEKLLGLGAVCDFYRYFKMN